jgi:LysR family transcriptional activator of nhaA
MSWLNYHHLYYFWVVAREGSIARATTILRLAQPTISSQLRQLEESFGERLLERRGRGLVLTETGQTVLRFADEIFAVGRELQQTLQGNPSSRPLRFAVGIADSLPKLTTYRLLWPAFQKNLPLRLIFRIDKIDHLLTELASHNLDLVLSDAPAPHTVRVRSFNHLLGESAVNLYAAPAIAARYSGRSPKALNGAPFILQTENSAVRRALDQWFSESNIQPKIVAEVEDVALLQVLGQQGLGIFAAPSVVEAQIRKSYGVRVVFRLPRVKARFFAISVERRLKHPGVLAIRKSARQDLFAG